MADIICNRQTVIMIADEDSLLPANDLYPSNDLYPQGVAREVTNIVAGSLKLDEILSESPLVFGQMYATKFEVKVYNEEDISGKWIHVYQIVNGIYIDIFSGKIDSCKLDKIGTDRTIIAYDKAYTFGQINVAPWWESYWQNRTTSTLKQARDSMLNWCNISFEDVTLPNDSLVIQKNVTLTSCTLTDMLRMMCELSHCFPHMDRTGYLEFVMLDTEATPVDISDDYEWMNSNFEDYETDEITGVQFYDSDNQLKWTVGTADNAYPIRKNIFLYRLSNEEYPEMVDTTILNNIGNEILNYLSDLKYTPATVKMIVSNLNLKLGDYVQTSVGNFYVLEHYLSGSQLIEQTLRAKGEPKMYEGEPVFDYGELILNEKIARIKYTVDGLESTFAQTINGIFANYKEDYAPTPNETTSTANLPASTWINQGTEADHLGEVFYYKNSTGQYGIYYRWDKVNNSYKWVQIATSQNAYTVVSSTFKQTADSISSEVTRASNAEATLRSNLTQTASQIRTEVAKSYVKYTGSAVPTTSNYPANQWTTDAKKAEHVGEAYYNASADKYYVWKGSSGDYVQVDINYYTENSYDYAKLFTTKNGTTYASDNITGGSGTESEATTSGTYYLPAPSDNKLKVYWHSDSSVTKYGFEITNVRRTSTTGSYSTGSIPSATTQTYTGTYPNHHPYGSNEDYLYEYTIPNGYYWEETPKEQVMASCVDIMQSSITQTAEAIELKVSAQDIVSTLNSQLLISGNRIELNTDGKIIINGTNFKVDANGKITAKDATLSGTMTAGSDSSYKIELKDAAANFYYQGTKVGQIDISGQDLIEIYSDRRVKVGRNNTYISMPTDDHMYVNARNDIIFECSSFDISGISRLEVQSGTYGLNASLVCGDIELIFHNGILIDYNQVI